MKILAAIDDSHTSPVVVQALVKQLPADRAQIRVLHVLQPLSLAAPPQMSPGYAPELEDQKKEKQIFVEQIAAQLRGAGFAVESTRVEIGDVREKIVDAAAEWGADLIVVGSHSRSGIRRLLLGSVAEFVARHAHCSVQIVRPRAGA